MDEKSSKQPLLSRNENFKATPNYLVSSTKWILKVAMWLIFITWAALIFLYPSDVIHNLYIKFLRAVDTPVFGTAGNISNSTLTSFFTSFFDTTCHIAINEYSHCSKTRPTWPFRDSRRSLGASRCQAVLI